MSMELQRIDMNCNDCKHLERMFGPQASAATDVNGKVRAFYGHCKLKDRRTTFMPGICTPENATCFIHRKDPNPSHYNESQKTQH